MSRGPITIARLLALAVMVVSGCTDVGRHAEEAQAAIDQMGERGRFCLSLTRAFTAIEAGSPGTAQDAIEEAVTQAPDDLLDEVRAVADAVRAARDHGADALRDPALQEATDALRERTRDRCDPT